MTRNTALAVEAILMVASLALWITAVVVGFFSRHDRAAEISVVFMGLTAITFFAGLTLASQIAYLRN